ncbi:ARM repeat-containing protein [Macrolepiota fuliginosa MF-IS2]|uniref:ARM repeat-containing protein n=1 Tax=Macrolepiota fuliginosa MF-IS2 TaxID=1400762 RepID=A0A9P5XQU8_9AGAR|nr:ARM repeat-containing protein [Macrolepiota fuliginosa MF-IS2]
MSENLFTIVKPTCVALLGSASLTSSSIPNCLRYLNDLASILQTHCIELPQLSPSLVSYIFFPVSSILQRNAPSTIPDQILEKIFVVLGFLSESWWWHCEIAIWEQIFMLCSSVLGGMANKGKGKDRDDEVKVAAAQCLHTLLRECETESPSTIRAMQANARLTEFKNHAQSPHFLPILGQALSAIIDISESRSFLLQQTSIKVLRVLLESYAPDQVFPMVLPGVVSSMSKVALGTKLEKQWANGEIVAASLHAMQIAIVRTVGDDICIKEGALHNVENLESLAELVTPSVIELQGKTDSPSATKRTPSWLKGTTSQLHIAMNNLNTLTGHPTPVALRALASFSRVVLEATPQTLPQTQPLFLAFLLSMFNSPFDSVSSEARSHLSHLLSDACKSQAVLLQTLMRNIRDYLSALPRLISIREESKVQHLAGLITAVCSLVSPGESDPSSAISKGIGKLLGPSGGIEKWGWSLLSVFEFSEAPITVVQTSAEQLMLENDPHHPQSVPFPGFFLKNMSGNTLQSIEQMFRALGGAGGETCLYSVEWFIGIGQRGVGKNSVAAMWCACHLLEGISGVNLSSEDRNNYIAPKTTRRLEKLARSLARNLPELWDHQMGDADEPARLTDHVQVLTDTSLVEHKRGWQSLHENLRIIRSSPATITEASDQPINHRVLTLQVISVCVGILQSRTSSLFIHVLYPVLHSLVSQVPFLASTGYSSLHFMTLATSYASPANLLLSNFDYVLDAISRRLTRRWLDVDATHVFVMLVRLVGSDVVEKAGDVVEECFDRLDEFHGYDILVDGLVSVLVEVTKVLKNDVSVESKHEKEPTYTPYARLSDLSEFFGWYHKRHEHSVDGEGKEDYGPAPRRAWGGPKQNQDGERADEEEEEATARVENTNDEPPPTPTQALTKQIVSRSLYFLTHGSPVIRARILMLLASSVPNLPSSALMPAIHSAWPFILNRLSDQETFVVNAAASLIEALSTYMGELMFRRIWDDVWPKFRVLLSQLQAADRTSALIQRREDAIGTEFAYTHSHRLYRAVLNTMTAALGDVHPHERSFWDVLVLFRRFLNRTTHPELQQCARRLYKAAMTQNADAVWLVLSSTCREDHPIVAFLYNEKWDVVDNVQVILGIISAE